MIKLVKFSHNRDEDFKKSSDNLLDIINRFADQPALTSLYAYFRKWYNLPENVIKQGIKKRIANLYMYKKAKFDDSLKLKWILMSFIKHLGLLLYALICSRWFFNVKNYRLIVDGIASKIELLRFKKLIDLIGRDKVLIITTYKTAKDEFKGYNIEYEKKFKHYNARDILYSFFYEIIFGVWLYLILSIRLNVNLILLMTPVINDYLKYSKLFSANKADYIVQERHYATNAVKNYLFKKNGGRASTCIQKNIIQLDAMYYYCDIDWFFSLGNRTADGLFEYGARIDKIIPVGSMFMEYYWFSNQEKVEKNLDIVMLGINVMNAYERMDSYSKFIDDYYDCIRWLVRFKNDYPSYRIAIKHHSSAGEDKIEEEIIASTGLEAVDKNANSYKIAFGSRCAVTYGSTMGYELNAHGILTFFLNPNKHSTILLDYNDKLLEGLNVASYEIFRDKVLGILSGDNKVFINADDICINSSIVSNRIYKELVN
ncbi:MAG: hypothetical protein PHV77_00295 [Candidatus Omnitrophica bacterium]|nr:hypothetical protein [Candidatus Omnitrophota bacterium]